MMIHMFHHHHTIHHTIPVQEIIHHQILMVFLFQKMNHQSMMIQLTNGVIQEALVQEALVQEALVREALVQEMIDQEATFQEAPQGDQHQQPKKERE